MEQFESSELAKVVKVAKRIPFEELVIGKSFIIPFHEVTSENSLRVMAYKKSKSLGRIFKIIKHVDLGVYEIARLADPDAIETMNTNLGIKPEV